MKKCNRCGLKKKESEFYKDKQKGDNLTSYCGRCVKFASRGYYSKNKKKTYKRVRAYILKNKERWKKWYRTNSLKRRYGITNEQYEDILKSQNNKCAICGTRGNKNTSHLCVDHNHKTKKVRGLLCHKCNNGMGHFSENIEMLERVIDYLKKYA